MASGEAKTYPELLYSFRPKCGEILSLKCISDAECVEGAGIISGSSSGAIDLWSLKTKRSICQKKMEAPVVLVDACHINQECRILSQLRGGKIVLWDLTMSKSVSHQIDDPGFCKLGTFDNKSKFASCFVIPHSKQKLDVRNLETNRLESSFTDITYDKRGYCMCIKTIFNDSTGVSYVCGGFEDGSVVIWDERQTDKVYTFGSLFSDPIFAMAIDPSSAKGVVGSHHESLQFFKILWDKGIVEKRNSLSLKNQGVTDIAVRSDSKIFATGGMDGRVRVFGWSKGKPLAAINYHTACVNAVRFASPSYPEPNLLICGSKAGVISAWKLY